MEENTYTIGFRNGYADCLLGLRLAIALTSQWERYAEGYRQGQAAAMIPK